MALTPGQIVAALAPIVGRVGAAGIAGNLQQESGNNPASAGGGLAQWQGPRYVGLQKYAQSRGLPATSAQAALGYLAQDLKGPYSGLANQLRQAKDPGHAATLFSNIYERPGTPMLGNRINYARQALGSSPQGLSALPTSPQTAQQQTTSTQVPTFNQAGFQKATKAFVAGNFLSHQAGPYDTGGSGSNPLFSSGLLTTTAPNPQDFQGHRTIAVAQSHLQRLAGPTALTTHPAIQGGGDFATPAPQKVVAAQNLAKTLIGAPYSQANHAAAFTQANSLIKKYGVDCSGFVSILLGARGVGVLSGPQTTETLAAQPGIQPGRGQHVTVFNRSGAGANSHMIIQIGLDWFESGGRIGRGVVQMSAAQAQQELGGGGFVPLHPNGF